MSQTDLASWWISEVWRFCTVVGESPQVIQTQVGAQRLRPQPQHSTEDDGGPWWASKSVTVDLLVALDITAWTHIDCISFLAGVDNGETTLGAVMMCFLIRDVELEFRKLFYRRSAASAVLLKLFMDNSNTGTVDVCEPLTHALRLPIAADRPGAET
ncbi:hypothetical protein C2E23DRAFT_888993 [Lenzites betulinus]|nr:hypothetical protein C2E23DRAFT_888993 [Lenzites betulinus]